MEQNNQKIIQPLSDPESLGPSPPPPPPSTDNNALSSSAPVEQIIQSQPPEPQPEPSQIAPPAPAVPAPVSQTPPPPASQNPHNLPIEETPNANAAGVIILQWLTYAFWGWTVLTMSMATVSVLSSFIGDNDTGTFTGYSIAALLVLLPISILCDIFYSKKEPAKKAGAATIVMVIHAVIFALFGIASLIGAVFSIVTMFISSSDTTGSQIALYSFIISAGLYSATLLRTINPTRFPWIVRYYKTAMAVVIGLIVLLGLFGPVAKERVRKNDKLIESSLSQVKSSVDKYTNDNNRLPASLSDVTLYDDSKKLVEQGLVTYKPETKSSSSDLSSSSSSNSGLARRTSRTQKIYYYELCVTYKKSKEDRYRSSSDYDKDSDGYTSTLSTSGHESGEVCYKLKNTDYN